jgi:hypothetical protein
MPPPTRERRVSAATAKERLKLVIDWCNAYPEEIFLPVSHEDMERAHKLLAEHGISMGAMHGQWARHIVQGIKKIAEGKSDGNR